MLDFVCLYCNRSCSRDITQYKFFWKLYDVAVCVRVYANGRECDRAFVVVQCHAPRNWYLQMGISSQKISGTGPPFKTVVVPCAPILTVILQATRVIPGYLSESAAKVLVIICKRLIRGRCGCSLHLSP